MCIRDRLYNEDAVQGAKILGIALKEYPERDITASTEFPTEQLDSYLSKLVRAGEMCIRDRLPQVAEAQIAASNPLEWTALAEGNELINEQIEKQIKGQTQTALLQNSIASEFNQIHKWERQYNSCLLYTSRCV